LLDDDRGRIVRVVDRWALLGRGFVRRAWRVVFLLTVVFVLGLRGAFRRVFGRADNRVIVVERRVPDGWGPHWEGECDGEEEGT
jgi:hypothetical protein